MEFTIEGDDPFFAGHFPGRPVFPGVGQLARVAAFLPEGGREIRGIEQLRFRRALGPGDRVEVSLDPGDSRVRFELRSGSLLAAGGVLRVAAPGGAGNPPAPALDTGEAGGAGEPDPRSPLARLPDLPPVDPVSLVPHRAPALLLVSLDAAGRAGARATAWIPPDSPYREGGPPPGFLAIEIASQAAAALETFLRSAGGGPPDTRPGFLVSARDVECAGCLPDSAMTIAIEDEGGSPPLALYRFRITGSAGSGCDDGGRRDSGPRMELARGRIGTWIQEGPLSSPDPRGGGSRTTGAGRA